MAETKNKPSPQTSRKSVNLPLLLSGGLILAVVGAYFLWPAFGETTREGWNVLLSGDQAKISGWVKQFGYWGPVFIILFMVLQMFMVVVNVVALIIIAILAYGPVWGSLIGFTGVMVASLIGYAIGYWAGSALVQKLLGEKTAKKVEEQVCRYGIWAIVIARLSPFISNDAISFIAGSTKLTFWKFIAATIGGIVPLIVLIAFLGGDIERMKTGLIWISVIGIVAFLAYYFYDRHKQQQSESVKKQ